MGYPRKRLVDPDHPGTYHCVSRCVRQAWLLTHASKGRRKWIRKRILWLASIFPVAIDGFAVMSNHYHLQLYIDPTATRRWPDAMVASSWVKLYARRDDDKERIAARVQALLDDPVKLQSCRQRLGTLSEFMARLNEYVARRANHEDDRSGRFWDGRYRCQPVLDAVSRLRSMAYIDLNPLRAGESASATEAPNTSAAWRAKRHRGQASLCPIAGRVNPPSYGVRLDDYRALLSWTAGHTPVGGEQRRLLPAGILSAKSQRDWCLHTDAVIGARRRVLGCVRAIRRKAADMGQQWLWGVGYFPTG